MLGCPLTASQADVDLDSETQALLCSFKAGVQEYLKTAFGRVFSDSVAFLPELERRLGCTVACELGSWGRAAGGGNQKERGP